MTIAEIESFVRGIARPMRKELADRDARIDELSQRLAVLEARPVGLMYRGVWTGFDDYAVNEAVTFRGSLWVAKAPSCGVEPGGDGGAWQLAVKRGRDGKDGR
jgi:hypothetical protein